MQNLRISKVLLEPPSEVETAIDALLKTAMARIKYLFENVAAALTLSDCELTRSWANTVNGPYTAELYGLGITVA